MKTALIYPPSADPTAPYLSVPMLTGYLRSRGLDVMAVDANIEAYDYLLRESALTGLIQKAGKRLGRLQQKPSLSHTDQLAFGPLFHGAKELNRIPQNVGRALSVMRGEIPGFYDPLTYEAAHVAIRDALELISSAYTPLGLDFCAYQTPFSLLSLEEIVLDAQREKNPFYDYFEQRLAANLAREHVGVAGISIAFPSQIQSAYTLAMILRKCLPDIYLVAGGPAITQVFARLTAPEARKASGPFDAVVLYEGEETLFQIVSALESGHTPPRGIMKGKPVQNPEDLPAPDFDGLPLHLYLSPEPVLPYDPSRGCYWGKCAFCHYGLAEKGTAAYRERPVEQVSRHLMHLSDKYKCRIFYLSQDTLAPKTARELALAFHKNNAPFRFGSDIRPEPQLTLDWAKTMADGGALSFALGIESGSARILGKINKGIKTGHMQQAVDNLAQAGIAAECMCFTQFPTETYREAMETVRFLQQRKDRIALFMCGEFSLSNGAGVAQRFKDFGLSDIWHVNGDEFIKTLFYTEEHPSKSLSECGRIDQAIHDLSQSYWFHAYPWAGSLSTAHTLLWYGHHGPDAFRRFARTPTHPSGLDSLKNRKMIDMEAEAQNHESMIWQTLVHEKRSVSRHEYQKLAKTVPPARQPMAAKKSRPHH